MGLAAAIVVTLTSAGTLLLVQGDTPTVADAGEDGAPGDMSATREPRAATTGLSLLPVTEPAVPLTPSPSPRVSATARSLVTPTPPRLLVIAPAPVGPAELREIAAMKGVRKVTVVGGGTVRVSGVTLKLLAVDPVGFRPWAPEAVSAEPEVWAALDRGEYVAATSAVNHLNLVLGAEYQIDGGPRLRVAASVVLGIPGIDGVVSEETGRRLGLRADGVVLVNGPRAKIGDVSRQVRRLLGSGTQVVAIGPTGRAVIPTPAVGTPKSGVPKPGARKSGARKSGLVGRPGSYLELYRRAAGVCPGLSWTVLAAIGQVESGHGRNNGPSSAGALGPMQFMPATWKTYGLDGDGDGRADIWSPYDAVPSAAGYLCANGAGQGGAKLEKAIWFYNHSSAYVSKVMGLAAAYAAAYP